MVCQIIAISLMIAFYGIYFTKLFKYRTANVREYWIVDPAKERVIVYGFENETMEEYTFVEDIPAGIFEGFSIRVY